MHKGHHEVLKFNNTVCVCVCVCVCGRGSVCLVAGTDRIPFALSFFSNSGVDCCQNNLIGFVVHGEPDHVEIYDDGKQASSRYTEAVIDIAIPEEYRHTKFSNITISFPAGNQHSYFVLCEVEVFSGKLE